MEARVPKCHAMSLRQGATGRSAGTSGWDWLVWRLEYLNVMLCPSARGQLVDLQGQVVGIG